MGVRLAATARDPGHREALSRLVDRVDVPVLATRLLDDFRLEIPSYGRFAHQDTESQILRVVGMNLELAFRWLSVGRPPTEADVEALRRSARQRASEGMPLEDLLTAYRMGGRVAWQSMLDLATQREHQQMFFATDVVMRYVNLVSAAVTSTYVDERSMVASETERGARQLLAALCRAEPPSPEDLELAEQGGFAIRTEYVPFVAVLPGVSAVRHAELAAYLRGARALAVTEGSRVTGLLAAPLRFDALGLGADLVVAQGSPTPRAALAPALEQLRVQVDVARRAGHTGSVGADDFLPELLLGSTPQIAARIERRVFGPLDGVQNGELTATLETLAACGFHRQRTARALPVHRNTLIYRLQRVEELTGLVLDRASDQTLVWLAAAQRRGG